MAVPLSFISVSTSLEIIKASFTPGKRLKKL